MDVPPHTLVKGKVERHWIILAVLMSSFASILAIYWLTRRHRLRFTVHSPRMSPDTVSSLFPDRPIRPLPKRRLRETLSPELADSIKYPPSAHDNTPLFFYPPYTLKDEPSSASIGSTSPVDHSRRNEPGPNYIPQRNGVRSSQGEEDSSISRSALVTRSPPDILTRSSRRASRLDQPRSTDPQPPPSAASSVDGYDSFENTNNKKKRKIPSAGDTALSSSHALNGDISSLAVSGGAHSPVNDGSGDRSYSSSSAYTGTGPFISNSQGISGSGRGRLGRSRNGRSPLRALPDGNNTWSGRNVKAGAPQWAQPDHENSGIISSAIANAEKLPPQGQENVSLLQQHSMAKATPASTQFTFTCDSQVPGSIQWPGHLSRNGTGTQTTSGVPPGAHANSSANHDGSSKAPSRGSAHSRRKARRHLERELAIAARHRRQVAADNYYHNPPKFDDVWICEFCEYERIFGEPPRALIRDYEIKDRRHRQEEADRKRLLEKAKAKGRKNRKAGKVPGKGSPSVNQVGGQPHTEHIEDNAPPMHQGHSHSTQSEEDYEDEFDDDYSNPPLDPMASGEAGGGTPGSSRDKT